MTVEERWAAINASKERKAYRDKHHIAKVVEMPKDENGRVKPEYCNDKEYRRAYYIKNKEKERERKRLYRESHREAISRYHKKYRETHKEYRRAYYIKNKEKERETKRLYRESHREAISRYHKKYRETHKEEIKVSKRNWYLKNKKKAE